MTYTIEEIQDRVCDLGFVPFVHATSGILYSQSDREETTDDVCLSVSYDYVDGDVWISSDPELEEGIQIPVDEFMDSVRYIGLDKDNDLIVDRVI